MSWQNTTTHNGSVTKTIAGKFKRLKFFHGMLLTEHDFLEEQTYFREKIKLHNRLHGYGVVWGLCLLPCPEASESERDCCTGKNGSAKPDEDDCTRPLSCVTIQAGFALDCNGNEILVCSDYHVSLEEKIKALERQGLSAACETGEPPKLYIGIRYCECCTDPAEQYTNTCNGDDLHPQFSRIREGFCVDLFTEEQLPDCAEPYAKGADDCHCYTRGSQCPGGQECEDGHTIILGCVVIEGDKDKRRCITADKITNLTGISPLSYQRWEAARRRLLEEACCRLAEWHDLTVVLGKSARTAQLMLSDLGIYARIRPFSSLEPSDLARVPQAQPCVRGGTRVYLVTEDRGGENACVMFVLPQYTYRRDDDSGYDYDYDYAEVAVEVEADTEVAVKVEDEVAVKEEVEVQVEKKPIPLDAVYFERNEAVLTEAAVEQLKMNVEVYRKEHAGDLRIDGYASRGEKNVQQLSEDRARAVEAFYIENGVDPARLTVAGCGRKGATGEATSQYRYVDTISTG